MDERKTKTGGRERERLLMMVTQNPLQQRPDVCCALPSSPSISPSSLLSFFSLHFFSFYSPTSFSNNLVFYPSVTRVTIYCSFFLFIYFFCATESHFNIIQQVNSGATGGFTLHRLLCCSDRFLLFFVHTKEKVLLSFSRSSDLML